MKSVVVPIAGQQELFAVVDPIVAARDHAEAVVAAVAAQPFHAYDDHNAGRRAEILADTGIMDAEQIRMATGVGEVATAEAIVQPRMARRDWTPAERAEHLAGAERTRQFLETLGMPRTRFARERSER